MLVLECSGSPYQIGFQHGQGAAAAVARSIELYKQMFKETSNLSWDEALEIAQSFEGHIVQKWPRYHDELQGLADGAAQSLLAIVALNIRTEIVYGKWSDGCTSAFCKGGNQTALLGQNWDWVPAQAPNLILMTIRQKDKPTIKMVTEAGLIGKIGLNSAGVGVCFNALRVTGVSPSHIPAHLALRAALESRSALEAVETVERAGGLASAAYILVGDCNTATGLECTSVSVVRQQPDQWNRVTHANNLLFPEEHAGAEEPETWIADSTARVKRMNDLLAQYDNAASRQPSASEFARVFEDDKNYPQSICRAVGVRSTTQSLFNIVMNLAENTAVVREGRPGDGGRTFSLDFEESRQASATL